MERFPKKLYYKIGEVCDLCKIEPHVLRYWETEFSQLSPSKNNSGQRVYRYRDLQLVQRIKQLLYEEGYTIAGANRKLASERFDANGEVAAGVIEALSPSDSLKTDQPAGGSRHSLKGTKSDFSAISPHTGPKKLMEEIRSQLKSVLEILK